MSLVIDRKYVALLSPRLDRFVQKRSNLWACRCPICKDSQKNKYKSRGYFYTKKNSIFFKCFNCNISLSLRSLLRTLDLNLYNEYNMENYKEKTTPIILKPRSPALSRETIPPRSSLDIPNILSLPPDHAARQYIASRKIPVEAWNRIYYAVDFLAFCRKTFPETTSNSLKKLNVEHDRIVLPFFNEKNILQGVQGRAISDSAVRYITVKATDDSSKLFGLERIDKRKTIYVLEGPIDSFFLPNSLATMDSNLLGVREYFPTEDIVFVPDNEPRNKEVLKMIGKYVKNGEKVVIWPDDLPCKDINDMVLADYDPLELVKNNTFQGLRSQLEYTRYRKA